MEPILPGVRHWTAEHPDIHQTVSCYALPEAGILLDPLMPEEGPGAFADMGIEQIVLSVGLHTRSAPELAEALGATIRLPEAGAHRHADAGFAFETFAPGDELAPGVVAHELGAIAPDDGVLHLSALARPALHFADGLLVRDGALALMPDELMDDPEQVRATTLERLEPLLELDFDALLFAHSDPIGAGGRDQLAGFVRRYRT